MATYVQQYRLADADAAKVAVAAEVAQQIESKQYKLMDLVLSIGEDVNSPDATVRAQVVEYLGAVLAQLNPATLSRQDVSLLTKYLNARIENDRRGVKETAQALRTLLRMKSFFRQDAPSIVDAIYSSVTEFPEDYFGQVDTTRLEILGVLSDLLEKHEAVIKSNGSDKFIDTLLACAARESRARNLMIWFSVMHTVLKSWDLKEHVVPCWERLSMYFPITMNPVALASEKAGVTVDQLKQKLRDCISATALFAPHAFKLLIDKIKTHTAVAVKKDILLTLNACVKSYTPEDVAEASEEIFNNLKYEVFSGAEVENELPGLTLDVLQSISKKLSTGLTYTTLAGSSLDKYIRIVVDECFSQPNKEEAKRNIVSAIERPSFLSFHLTVDLVLPKTFMKYYGTPKDAVSEREEHLKTFHSIMKDRITVLHDKQAADELSADDKQKESASFSQFATQLFNIFEDLLETSYTERKYRQFTLGIQGTTTAIVMADLSKDTIVRVARRLANGIVDWEQSTGYNVYEEMIRGLQLLTTKYPDIVADYALPILEAVIPDDILPTPEYPVVEQSPDFATALKTLEGLSKICTHGPLFTNFHSILVSRLRSIGATGHVGKFANLLLSSLLFNLQQRDETYRTDSVASDGDAYQALAYDLIHTTISFEGENSLKSDGVSFSVREYIDNEYLTLVGRIVSVVVGSERFNNEPSWTEWAIGLVQRLLFPSSDQSKSILATSSHEERAIVLVTSLLAGLRKEAKLAFDPTELANVAIRSYFDTPIDASSVIVSEAKLGFISLLINKWNAGKGVSTESPLTLIKALFQENFESTDQLLSIKTSRLAFSFATASLLKMDRSANELLELLITSLNNETRGNVVASGFSSLLAESPILTKRNYAVIRLLYKQSTFNFCVPRLLKGFADASSPITKSNYLLATMGLLQHGTPQLIVPFSEQLMPILMAGLSRPETNVMNGAVKTLAAIFRENSAITQEHARSIVTKSFLGATATGGAGRRAADLHPNVRADAVNLVTLMAQCLPTPAATQLRPLVLKQLHAVKDSPYRAVRVSAVACHAAWFPVVPTGEDD